MKKKLWIPIVIVILLAALTVPVPLGVCDDGGTRVYAALTYKVVSWKRPLGNGTYEKTCVYPFPGNFRSLDRLWEAESAELTDEFTFRAVIREVSDSHVTVHPVPSYNTNALGDLVTFGTESLAPIDVAVGDTVSVTYTGVVMETYPTQIIATNWSLVARHDIIGAVASTAEGGGTDPTDHRNEKYTEEWLDRTTAQQLGGNESVHIVITDIYADCFFARPVVPLPYVIKLNGVLSDEWCVGDQVSCTYENTYYDEERYRMEADMRTVEASDRQEDLSAPYKPVIYLYPEVETEVSVSLTLNGALTCTYPTYRDGWTVTASPDGVLTDARGQVYNYLYWEGETYAHYDLSQGFCVRGEDTAAFLEDALARLGLTRREANEFIVFWLPRMEQNPYNIITFQTDRYTETARLDIDPAPDTLIRVFMAWQASDTAVELPAQSLSAPERRGFTVVEWGGTDLSPK